MPQGFVPQGFVDAATVVDGLVVDMRYFGADNFVGAKIDGYEAPVCLLTRPAAAALARCSAICAAGSGSRCSTATGRRARWRISCAGRATSRT